MLPQKLHPSDTDFHARIDCARAAVRGGPRGRRGVEPDDVVRAIRFLIDSPAITGQVIIIDGGQRFLGLGRDVQNMELE